MLESFAYWRLRKRWFKELGTFATGSTGTIGSHLPKFIAPIKLNLKSNEEFFHELVLSADDTIIHLGGIVGPSLIDKDPETSFQVNVLGAKKLAEVALQKNIERFVYVSTSHVYKLSDSDINESYPTEPSNSYAKQKLEAEIEIEHVFSGTPEKLCIVRVFSVLDWNVKKFTLGGAVKRLAMGEKDFVLQNGDDLRDFLTPSQIAGALAEISRKKDLVGVVNLCTNTALTVREAVARMLTESHFNFDESMIAAGQSGMPRIVGKNTKLREHFPDLVLSWTPSLFAEDAD